eukprot:jgi/Bigna1/84196/fgenesh1_pg.125_\
MPAILHVFLFTKSAMEGIAGIPHPIAVQKIYLPYAIVSYLILTVIGSIFSTRPETTVITSLLVAVVAGSAHICGMDKLKSYGCQEYAAVIAFIAVIIMALDIMLQTFIFFFDEKDNVSLSHIVIGLIGTLVYTTGLFSVKNLHSANKIGWLFQWASVAFDFGQNKMLLRMSTLQLIYNFVLINEFESGTRSAARLVYYGIAAADVGLYVMFCMLTVVSPLVGDPNLAYTYGLGFLSAVTDIPSLVTSIAVDSYRDNDFITFQTVFKVIFLFKSIVYDIIYISYQISPDLNRKYIEPKPRWFGHVFTPFTLIWALVVMTYEINQGTDTLDASIALTVSQTFFSWLTLACVLSVDTHVDYVLGRSAEASAFISALLLCCSVIFFSHEEYAEERGPNNSGVRLTHLVLAHFSLFLYSLRIFWVKNVTNTMKILWVGHWIDIIFAAAALIAHRRAGDPGGSTATALLLTVQAINLFYACIRNLLLSIEDSLIEVNVGAAFVNDITTRPIYIIGASLSGATCVALPFVEQEINKLARSDIEPARKDTSRKKEGSNSEPYNREKVV